MFGGIIIPIDSIVTALERKRDYLIELHMLNSNIQHLCTIFTISVRLVGTTAAATINGFLVQARVPGDTPTLGQTPMLLGSFQNVSGQQTYDCDGAGVADQVALYLFEFKW